LKGIDIQVARVWLFEFSKVKEMTQNVFLTTEHCL